MEVRSDMPMRLIVRAGALVTSGIAITALWNALFSSSDGRAAAAASDDGRAEAA
jgi:hypothetical protein